MKFLLLLLITAAFCLTGGQADVGVIKSGTCPPPGPQGICLKECSGDQSCPGSQKCCQEGCGSLCRNPVPASENICSLPQEVGPCDDSIPAWWYNKATNRCTLFYYGGCNGNGNRFDTQAECENKCSEGKPGRCRGWGMICAEQYCNGDDSKCRGDFKCCYSGCGYTCQLPI